MALNDKVVLVTGAGSGLGAATAIACAREGATLHLVDQSEEGIAATLAKIAEHGVEVTTYVTDLGQRRNCIAAVEGAITRHSRLDGLCNVAGIIVFHRVGEVTEADWTKVMAITLNAPFFLSQAALPELIRNRGSIVNVASSGGIKGEAYCVPYASAKAAVIHMTKCMAMEFMHEPVRINCLAPGAMMTNITGGRPIPDGLDRDLIRRYSGLRPPADPMDAANMIAFMLSEAAPSLHGSVISVDGGVTAD